jgi:glycosyltransferase involved in cell wall biosynthesis
VIKVSVIVPVYNTQDYLKECMESAVSQTLADIEIICVNDGSSDDSLTILEDYQKSDSRITVINQENAGVGAARNAALDVAQGEYVFFLDSDDYMDVDALDYLYNTSKDKNLDILMFGILNFNSKTGKKSHSPYFDMDFLREMVQDNVFNWRDIKDRLFDVSVTLYSRLFKRELISYIRFAEGLIFEDNLFSIMTLMNAERIYFSDSYLYYRRIRQDSITNSYHERFTDCMDIYNLIIEFMDGAGRLEEFNSQIFDRQCFDVFHRFKQLDTEYKDEFYIKLKSHFLNQSDMLGTYRTLDSCSRRSLEIYNSATDSDTYREFELSVDLFDLQLKNNDYKKEVSRLRKANKKYKREIDDLKGSKSRKIKRIFKK